MATSHFDDLVRQGLVGVKSKRFGTWKKRWIVLRRYSSAGPTRIEEFTELQAFHRLNDSLSIHPIRIWPLFNVVGVTQGNSRPNPRKRKVTVFFANTSVEQFKFRTNTAQEAEKWRHDIEEVSSMVYADMRVTDESASSFPTVGLTERFRVFLRPSPLLHFMGECHMEVTSSHVIITDLWHSEPVITWDIATIRRFGCSEERLLRIEAGRSSSTGEGIFEFQSFEAQKIERHLNAVTFALSTAVRVMETDVNRVGAPVVPSRPSQHQMQRQRQQQRNPAMEADGWYMLHARSEPGSSAGLVAFSDSPETYRRPSAPDPSYPPATKIQSPPAVTNRMGRNVFPMYLPPASSPAARGGRRPSTPVFFANHQSPPLSAPPFRFSQDSLSQDDESIGDLESPPVLPGRMYQRCLASSNDLTSSQAHQSTSSYLEYPNVPPGRTHHRQSPASSAFQSPHRQQQQHQYQQHQQHHQQDRLPEVTSIPPRPTRTAFFSTSSCPSQSSPPPHTHSSRRKPPPPPPPPYDIAGPPPPIPPRLAMAIRPTSPFSDSNDV